MHPFHRCKCMTLCILLYHGWRFLCIVVHAWCFRSLCTAAPSIYMLNCPWLYMDKVVCGCRHRFYVSLKSWNVYLKMRMRKKTLVSAYKNVHNSLIIYSTAKRQCFPESSLHVLFRTAFKSLISCPVCSKIDKNCISAVAIIHSFILPALTLCHWPQLYFTFWCQYN